MRRVGLSKCAWDLLQSNALGLEVDVPSEIRLVLVNLSPMDFSGCTLTMTNPTLGHIFSLTHPLETHFQLSRHRIEVLVFKCAS